MIGIAAFLVSCVCVLILAPYVLVFLWKFKFFLFWFVLMPMLGLIVVALAELARESSKNSERWKKENAVQEQQILNWQNSQMQQQRNARAEEAAIWERHREWQNQQMEALRRDVAKQAAVDAARSGVKKMDEAYNREMEAAKLRGEEEWR
jgi:hypothetical protein